MASQPLTENPKQSTSWILEEKRFSSEYLAKYEAIFTQGNGYLGQRAALDEHYWGETRNLFVCGTFDRFHDSEVSELPNLPDVTNLCVRINGYDFSLNSGRIEAYSRKLNLYTGELTRQVKWVSPNGAAVDIGWRRIVSMEDLHLLASQMTITAQSPLELTITSGIDGTVSNSGTQHTVEGHARVHDGGILEYPCTTLNSKVQIVTHVGHHASIDGIPIEPEMKIVTSRRYLGGKYTLCLEAGQTLVFEKLASVCTGRDMEYRDLKDADANLRVIADSLDHFRRLKGKTYNEVLAESSRVWEKFWEEHDVRIQSQNPDDQTAIRFAIYHLNIMTNHHDSRIGVAAKGLSGEGYKGHSFWDTETFIFPFFLFTQPEIGRNLLEYRHHSISGARELAHKRGYQGAMYPWESGWIEDGDVTPDNLGVDLVTGELLRCSTGEMEHHVTADIAVAVYQYYIATGDLDFMEQCGYELLLETARFWASRVIWNESHQRYEILHVIGPDEYQENVNNNAYTNYLAAQNMSLGIWVLNQLDAAPELRKELDQKVHLQGLLDTLNERLERMYLPQPDPKSGILPQFDGYLDQQLLDLTHYRNASQVAEIMKDYNFAMLRQYQVAKQADVVQLMFLREDLLPGELRRRNYLYYEPRTVHDSSLSKAIHSILASDLGMMKEAYAMFRGAANTDLGPEPHSSDDGIHSANMGGMWQAVVMGFGGVRMCGSTLRIMPHLPKQWQELNYRIVWQGSPIEVSVSHEQMKLKNNGPAVMVQTVRGMAELPAGGEVSILF